MCSSYIAVRKATLERSWLARMVRQSEGPGLKSRSGDIAYFHGVKTSLSTLGTGDVSRGSDST